jgi:hypothetical protein
MIRWSLSISSAVQGRAEGQSPGLDTGPSRLRIERSTPKTYPVGPAHLGSFFGLLDLRDQKLTEGAVRLRPARRPRLRSLERCPSEPDLIEVAGDHTPALFGLLLEIQEPVS